MRGPEEVICQRCQGKDQKAEEVMTVHSHIGVVGVEGITKEEDREDVNGDEEER